MEEIASNIFLRTSIHWSNNTEKIGVFISFQSVFVARSSRFHQENTMCYKKRLWKPLLHALRLVPCCSILVIPSKSTCILTKNTANNSRSTLRNMINFQTSCCIKPKGIGCTLLRPVTSHGAVSSKRVIELQEMLKQSSAIPIFVSAFPDFRTFTRYASEIAWETEVWVADNSDHMIHFNGEKFLRPTS